MPINLSATTQAKRTGETITRIGMNYFFLILKISEN